MTAEPSGSVGHQRIGDRAFPSSASAREVPAAARWRSMRYPATVRPMPFLFNCVTDLPSRRQSHEPSPTGTFGSDGLTIVPFYLQVMRNIERKDRHIRTGIDQGMPDGKTPCSVTQRGRQIWAVDRAEGALAFNVPELHKNRRSEVETGRGRSESCFCRSSSVLS